MTVADDKDHIPENALDDTTGGLCIVADGNYGLRNEKKEPLQPAEEGADNTGRSWFARWMSEIGSRAVKIDQKMTFGEQLLHWLQDDNHFEKQDGKAYFSPVNWAGESVENGHEVGQLMATNVNVSSCVLRKQERLLRHFIFSTSSKHPGRCSWRLV